MTQRAYEAAIAKLRVLGVMRADLQQQLGELQAQGLSGGRGAQALGLSIRDLDHESEATHRTIMALRTSPNSL